MNNVAPKNSKIKDQRSNKPSSELSRLSRHTVGILYPPLADNRESLLLGKAQISSIKLLPLALCNLNFAVSLNFEVWFLNFVFEGGW